MENLGKKELIDDISIELGENYTKKDIASFLDAFENTIKKNMEKGNEVTMRGFLKFYMYRRKTNALTEKMKLVKSQKDVVKCRVAKAFTQSVSGGE